MFRLLAFLSLCGLLVWGCGPDKLRDCSGAAPKFTVVLKLGARPLPADTVVHVSYAGSGKEDFRLSEPNAQLEVTFCQIANEDGSPLDASASASTGLGAAGAGGAAETGGASGAAGAAGAQNQPNTVPALICKLFTAGFTSLEVSGSGFMTVHYDLTPDKELCTTEKVLVLDAPDAG